jgi:hypothetical protein
MTFSGFATFAAVGGSVIVAGWSAMGFIGWRGQPVSQTVAEAPAARVAETFELASLPSDPGAAKTRQQIRLYDAAFLSPEPMTQLRPPVAASSAPGDGPVGLPSSVSREIVKNDAPNVGQAVRLAYAGEPQAMPLPRPQPQTLPQVKVSTEDQKALKAASQRWENGGPLTAHEIARIRAALHLTADQEAGWKDVEAVLVDIGRQQVAAQKAGKPRPTVSADVTQRLYWAAGPLLMSLREDQKREIRRIARVMGLESVASLI